MARFGMMSVWECNEVRVRHGCGIWKSVQKEQDVSKKFIHYKLGSDREINF